MNKAHRVSVYLLVPDYRITHARLRILVTARCAIDDKFGFFDLYIKGENKHLASFDGKAAYVDAHFFVHTIHIINMYYRHYFYFAVNSLITTRVFLVSVQRVT